ncbi:hypothetical protein BVRB_040490 [Beta vulgaris subsp. vulgaris]|uniref:Uncharacterized protein n=1 Tax=Beta vulgaris subsp. vulgaris TaxID=3555 RepID=A0A0J7YPE8_BETVV|nr:hypothetical protein BVRB_040490 [Beta vulgaris subsp. vulgaris]
MSSQHDDTRASSLYGATHSGSFYRKRNRTARCPLDPSIS